MTNTTKIFAEFAQKVWNALPAQEKRYYAEEEGLCAFLSTCNEFFVQDMCSELNEDEEVLFAVEDMLTY